MRTNCISAAYSNPQKMNFKGLWGEPYFSHTTSPYGKEGDIIRDHYELPYHACADETKEEIAEQIAKKQKALKPLNDADALCYHGSHVTAVEGGRLPVTKKQLAEVVKDCKEIISGNIPLNKALRNVLKIK